jgi:hypothetical protein
MMMGAYHGLAVTGEEGVEVAPSRALPQQLWQAVPVWQVHGATATVGAAGHCQQHNGARRPGSLGAARAHPAARSPTRLDYERRPNSAQRAEQRCCAVDMGGNCEQVAACMQALYSR